MDIYHIAPVPVPCAVSSIARAAKTILFIDNRQSPPATCGIVYLHQMHAIQILIQEIPLTQSTVSVILDVCLPRYL